MNAIKPVATVAALLITAAGMFGIATYSNAAADAQQAAQATARTIPTLQTIEVHPTPAELHTLHQS